MSDEGSAPILRSIYALVFLGLAAAVIGGALPEVQHALFALGQPYHFGAPPRLLPLLAALFAAGGALTVLVAFARRRPAPMPASLAILAGVVLAFFGLRGEVPPGRSWAAADKEILQTASALHRQMVDRLQQQGEVATEETAWREVLQELAKEPSPARGRGFDRLPYEIVKVADKDARPEALVPGQLLVWVAEDGVAFEVRPVGFDASGQVALLPDDKGEPLVLSAIFNPEMRQPRFPPQ